MTTKKDTERCLAPLLIGKCRAGAQGPLAPSVHLTGTDPAAPYTGDTLEARRAGVLRLSSGRVGKSTERLQTSKQIHSEADT